MAELRQCEAAELAATLNRNAEILFGLKPAG